jgi:hypothetical protein
MFVTVARRSTHPPLSPLSLDGQPLPQILSAYLFIFYSVYLHSRAFGPTQQTCIYAPCCSKRCRRIITHTVLVPNKPLVFICPPPHQPISPHVLLYMCILSIYSYIYYKNLHPSQKYCDILSGTEGQDWKQESEHPSFLIM